MIALFPKRGGIRVGSAARMGNVLLLLLLVILPCLVPAQTDTNVLQSTYSNQLYDGTPTNAPQTFLTETASIALLSGNVDSVTNSPATLASAPAPTDGQYYLPKSSIGQPVGGAPFQFFLPGMILLGPTNGTVFIAPASVPLNVQAWQLAFDEHVQTVVIYATSVAIGTNVVVAAFTNSLRGTNSFQATWTNDTPGACVLTAVVTDNLGASVTSAPVNITVVPVILVNGQTTNTHSFTFLATNAVSVTMTNPIPGGFVRYTTDGSPPANGAIYGGGALSISSSVLIRAEITDSHLAPVAEADPVNITVIPMYDLTATTLGGGSFTVSPPPTGPYVSNTVVTLTATPSNNWTFLSWTGDVQTNASSFQLTMNSSESVQAVFGTGLNVEQSPGGTILVSPNQSKYPYGSSVLLTAVPLNNFYFQLWLDGPTFAPSNSPVLLQITNASPVVLAGFASNSQPNSFSALAVEIGSGSGTVNTSPYATLYTHGASVSLTAMPATGQTFISWTGDGGGATSTNLVVTMTTNKTVIANFTANAPPTVAITNPPDGTTFTAPMNVTLGVTVTNSGGTVTNVAYLTNGVPMGAATNPPFTLIWTNANPGSYTLTAVATSTIGLSGTSGAITVQVNPPAPVFNFGSSNYIVHESGGSVFLNVVNAAGVSGLVNYQTAYDPAASNPAQSGNGIGGDYTVTQGSLLFSGQSSLAFSIPIIDNYINGPNLQFLVQLIGNGNNVGSLGTATVTIIRDDSGAATNALLQQVFPTNRPPMTGQLTVFAPPPEAGGQWKFPWEFAWRNSSDTATNLVAGDYPVQFRNIPGYLNIPLAEDPIVTNGDATTVTNSYYPTILVGSGATGSLTVNITPSNLAGAGWQFFGETAWRAPGSTVSGLLPDTYMVAFEPVSGYATPTSLAVLVSNGMSVTLSGTYVAAPVPPPGVDLPGSLSTSVILDYNQLPYGFSGQLQTDVGYGSGAAVTRNVVLTAAHMIFNDNTLSYVTNAFWSFQEQAGVFQPEPQAPRGWYVLSGYAAQRTNDLTLGGFEPDQPSPQSQDLDVAALYFLTYAARTGFGGYLSSDAVPNPYLTGSTSKTLVGYPVDGSMFGAVLTPGLMYATPLDPQPFVQTNDQVYAASWLFSYPGNSGGPLCVLYTNKGLYYPAAVYLGTLFNNGVPTASVVRAIDSNVVNLITLAADLGDSGTNNAGGGVITIIPNQSVVNNPAYLQFALMPPAAVTAGAGWRLGGDTTYGSGQYTRLITTTNAITVQFNTNVPGWIAPASQAVAVNGGAFLVTTNFYTVVNPTMSVNRALGIGITGTTNTRYRIQSRTNLISGSWMSVSTNTITNSGFNLVLPLPTNSPAPIFYRALWLTN